MRKITLVAAASMAALVLVGCKDEKKNVPVPTGSKEAITWAGSIFDATCSKRGGTLVRVEDTRMFTCNLPVEGVGEVEIDKEDPWFEPRPEDVVAEPVKDEKEVTYASDWDKEKVQKLDAKEIKVNPVQEKKVAEQKESDVKVYGEDVKEIYAHAPNKKFKENCDSKSGKLRKIHGGKWVCRYKE